jgi:hypothetical protein
MGGTRDDMDPVECNAEMRRVEGFARPHEAVFRVCADDAWAGVQAARAQLWR